ncbi:MAG: LamG-like jellyroll fold domain-containing protein, partial [Actinomycetota bacterium]
MTDTDADGVDDEVDNCVTVPNADQADADGDWIGDACELAAVAHWTFDDGAGAIATDAAGGNDLTLTGAPSWNPATGHRNGSLVLGGPVEYASADDADLPATMPGASTWAGGDFTMAAWINPTDLSDRRPILSKQGTSSGGARRSFLLSAGTSGGGGELYFEMYSSDASADKTSLTSALPLALDTWQHVAVTYEFVGDGTSVITMYVDGEVAATTATAAGPLQANSQPLDVGRYFWSNGYARYFEGQLDELRIFDSALTQDAIRNFAGPGTPPGNVAPTAAFTVDPSVGEIPLDIDVDASGSGDSDGTIAAYDWDFGDGTLGTGVTATHSYAAAGTYTITLTVTDDDGDTDTSTASVTAREPGSGPAPVVWWTFDEGGGSVAADSVGGNDLALSAGVSLDTAAGTATFDGSTGFGERADGDLSPAVPAAGAFTGDDFSITSWVWFDDLDDRRPIMSKQGTSSGGGNRGFLFTSGNGASAGDL